MYNYVLMIMTILYSNPDDIHVTTHHYKTLELCDNALTQPFKEKWRMKIEEDETFEMKLDRQNNKYSIFKNEKGYKVRKCVPILAFPDDKN